MRRDRLTRLLRRIVRHDTFESLIAPAVADLQHEANADWRQRAEHYAGLVIVIVAALLHDLRADSHLTSWPQARRLWMPVGACVALTASMIATPLLLVTPWHTLGPALVIAAATWTTGLAFWISLLTSGPAMVAFCLRRAGLSPARVVTVVVVLDWTAGTIVEPLVNIVMARSSNLLRTVTAPLVEDRLVAVDGFAEVWVLLVHGLFNPALAAGQPAPPLWWTPVTMMVATPMPALIGIIVARRQGWGVASRVFGVLLLLLLLQIITIVFTAPRGPLTVQHEGLRRALLLLSSAVIWLIALWPALKAHASKPLAPTTPLASGRQS